MNRGRPSALALVRKTAVLWAVGLAGVVLAATPEESRNAVISHFQRRVDELSPLAGITANQQLRNEYQSLSRAAETLKKDPTGATPDAMKEHFEQLRRARGGLMREVNFDPEGDDRADAAALQAYRANAPQRAPAAVPQQVVRTQQAAAPPTGPRHTDTGRPLFDGARPGGDVDADPQRRPPAALDQTARPPRAQDCAAFGTVGCVYIPSAARSSEQPTLLVYLRGHGPYNTSYRGNDGRLHTSGNVPVEHRLVSSREAFTTYGLDRLAHQRGVVVLTTGGSSVGVSPADIARLEAQLGRRFANVVVAAHSGGYSGLARTLDNGLPRVDRIVMLDNFYFGADLTNRIGEHVDRGTACRGFYAGTRGGRANAFATNSGCTVENQSGHGHFDGVNQCLPYYMEGRPCPPVRRRH
ncbi:MAG: hypothetical protein HY059_22275 [Proteobacteria bacterium]|nr:hypothetical protein [Pseudomonadota bacterium]